MSKFLDEIEACIPHMRRYAMALLNNSPAGDDLVQDTLEKAIAKQHTWQQSNPLKSWLFKIMLNTFRDDLRRERARPQLVDFDLLDFAPNTPASQENRLLLRETARAISQLPHEQRQALLLVSLENYNYAQAAEILEIPMGTLMSRMARARQFLRKQRDATPPNNTALRIVKK